MRSRFSATAGLILLGFAATGFGQGDLSFAGAKWKNPKDGMEFVRIPAGKFQAHVPAGTGNAVSNVFKTFQFEKPFWLGRTEVTVGQYCKFVKETGWVTEAERDGNPLTWRRPGFKQTSSHPVVFLGYTDALAYAQWAGVDLPAEAEWLYACKAGSTNLYPWGGALDAQHAWYRANTRGTGTRPVGKLLANAWDLHDTVGNAREYCTVGNGVWTARGSAWTRADSYLTRQGTMATNLIAEGVNMLLQSADVPPQYPPYPYDDDRGFRCIKRTP